MTSFHQLRFPKPDGSELAFHTLYGRVVLVDFFATSCAQCEVRIMPMLEKLYQRYQSKGFQVLGIALQPQAKEFLPPFLGVLKITYPTVIGDDTLPKGRTLFGAVSSIPRSYLLDRCGKIKHFFSGIPKRKELEAKIQSLLQQRPNCPQGG